MKLKKLHLGCGKRNFGPDWVHIDGGDFEHLMYHDVTKLPFDNESVDVIYACHLLNYFDKVEVVDVLKEWRRVLKNGATLRLAVPDFEAIAKLYVSVKVALPQITGPLHGMWKMGEKTIFHKQSYDFYTLLRLLESASFKNVRKYDWRATDHAGHDDHSQAYIPHMKKYTGTLISLNVEATR